MINKIMASSPYIEVAVRYLYWHSDFLIEKMSTKSNPKSAPQTNITKVIANLKSRGIKEGDDILVHSDYYAIQGKEKVSPNVILQALRELVGESGTIIMPAIPLFKGEALGKQNLYENKDGVIYDYNPKRTPPFTGFIPFALMKKKDAIRSHHPLNTVVAWGPYAEELVKDDLKGDAPRPNGVQSAWFKMYQRNTKIVMLGVGVGKSLTTIHTAEDMHGEDWVVPNWHRKRQYKLIVNGKEEIITVRQRQPKWGMLHFTERTLDKDLIDEGLVQTDYLDGVPISLLETKPVVDFLNSKNHTGYPYTMVPLKKKKPSF